MIEKRRAFSSNILLRRTLYGFEKYFWNQRNRLVHLLAVSEWTDLSVVYQPRERPQWLKVSS